VALLTSRARVHAMIQHGRARLSLGGSPISLKKRHHHDHMIRCIWSSHRSSQQRCNIRSGLCPVIILLN